MSFFGAASPRNSVILHMENTSTNSTEVGSPWNNTASIIMSTAGTYGEKSGWVVADSDSGGRIDRFQFVIPGTLADILECRVTSVDHSGADWSDWSSAPSGGPDGTWFTLDGLNDRRWEVNSTTGGTHTTTATMEVGYAGTSNAIASATFTWTINNEV